MATAFLISCGTNVNTKNEQITEKFQEENRVGNDVDPNGCKQSAGYIWSEAKNRCIRIWEEGTLFKKYISGEESRKNDPETIYVVLSDDKSKAELFFGGTDRPVLLDKNPEIEGDVSPILYERDYENVKIQYRKDAYWILHEGKAIYYNNYSEEDGFNLRLK